ncbi:MAG TPA: pyruvate kinase, partial [Vicinamibacterales bacterium]|nr:pyruvate kinase [Vicinamibacterales bacterium]
MRRTRILSTLGPSSDSHEAIAALLAAGSDAFRLNFSHGTAASHREVCARVRAVAAAAGRSVAVLQDLGGPKIRLGPLGAPFVVAPGDELVIERGEFPGTPGRLSCSFAALFTSVQAGHRVLVNDGRVELHVLEAGADYVRTRVVGGGTIEARKGMNLPDTEIQAPALT